MSNTCKYHTVSYSVSACDRGHAYPIQKSNPSSEVQKTAGKLIPTAGKLIPTYIMTSYNNLVYEVMSWQSANRGNVTLQHDVLHGP